MKIKQFLGDRDVMTKEVLVEDVIVSSADDSIGVLVASEIIEETNTKMVYLFSVNIEGDDEYTVYQHLETFSFTDHDFANEFIERLPTMTALEFILAMNVNSTGLQ